MIRVLRNTFFNLNAILIDGLFAFAFSIVAARCLGPQQYGVYGLLLWFCGFVGTFVNLGIPNTVAKFVSEYQGRGQPNAIHQIARLALKIELGLICLTCFALLVLLKGIAHLLGNERLTLGLFIAVVTVIPQGLASLFYSVLRGLQRYRDFFYVNLAVAPLTFLFGLIAIGLGYGVIGILIVNLLSHLVTFLSYYFLSRSAVFPSVQSPIDRELRKRILKYNLALVGIILLDMITVQRIEVFFLGKFRTLEEVGYYTLAFGLTWGIYSFIVKAMTGVLTPTASQLHGAGKEEELRNTYSHTARLSALVMIPICTLGLIMASWMIDWIYGSVYRQSVFPFQILMISACIASLAAISSSIAFGIGRQLFILKLGVITACLTLLLDFSFIPFFGTVGAACADLVVKMIIAASFLIYLYRHCMMKWPWKGMLKISFASFLAGFLSAWMMEGPWRLLGFCIFYPSLLLLLKGIETKDIQYFRAVVEKVPLRFRGLVLKTLMSVEGYVR